MWHWNETAWFSVLTAAAAKSTAVLAVAWLASILLRRRSAAARHLVWTAALAAILLLPFLSAALPVLRIPVADSMPPVVSVLFHEATAAPAEAATAPASPPTNLTQAAAPPAWRPDLQAWLMLLWAAGTLLALARTLISYAIAWRARRAATPLPPVPGVARPVDILQTAPNSMPVTLWLGRSVILMPADAARWSDERRRVVLLHELAHVRRGDALTHLLARLSVSLYWWHPLAWTAWREFLKERERAADDLVLAAGTRPSDYAAHLLEVARSLRTGRAIAWAGAAMARPSQLEGRLLAILDSHVDRAVPGRIACFAAALLAAVLVLPLAAVRAQNSPSAPANADIEATIRAAQSQKNYQTLDAAAQAAMQSKQYDLAQRLLEAALAIRGQTAGEQSVAYGVGLVKLAELQQKLDPQSGGGLLAEAAQILGESPEAARVLMDLGLSAMTRKDYAQAFDDYRHAQAVDPLHAAMPLMWMAVVRQHEADFDEAERLYRSALAVKDTPSADSAVILRVYAEFLKSQGRADDAQAQLARADAVAKNGSKTLPPLPAGVFRMHSGITPPTLVRKREPEYSEAARAAKLQGTVIVQVVIGLDGRARDARVLRELGLGLDENALEAISQWEFKPGVKDGHPVPVAATIEVNFRLL
ncbi:MAG TPA: TonB family protein [Bryobacteraceae bacterium]|nr:TonB family protein [Bryobacteraceae bacterium]